jgi:hypothetical protein
MATMTRRTAGELDERLDAAGRHVDMLTGTRFEGELTRAKAFIATVRYSRGEVEGPVTKTPAPGHEVERSALLFEERKAKRQHDEHREAGEFVEATWPGVVWESISWLLGDPNTPAPI